MYMKDFAFTGLVFIILGLFNSCGAVLATLDPQDDIYPNLNSNRHELHHSPEVVMMADLCQDVHQMNSEVSRLRRDVTRRENINFQRLLAFQRRLNSAANVQSDLVQRLMLQIRQAETRLARLEEKLKRTTTELPTSTSTELQTTSAPRPGENDPLKVRQKSHEINLLNIDQVRTLASASDKDYFKKSLLDPFLIVRPAGSDGNIKVQQHIKNYMSKYGWFIETDSFTDDTPYGKKPFTNIIATFNKYAPRKLTLACHFDSKYFTEFEFIGATDSAVPCAMMLDLARVLESYLKKGPGSGAWDVTLQFIFFDGEEAFKKWTSKDSIYGARHLAEKMAGNYKQVGRDEVVREIETMDALILLDLIGAKDPIFRNWFSKTEHLFKSMADIENRMAKNGMLEPVAAFQTRKYNKYFQYSKALGGGIQDDHIPFLERDVPVLHLIAYPFPDVWHRHDDDESALDYTTIDNLNRILRVFVAEYLHLYI